MKKKYKYLFLSSIVIGNLVTSPVFALTGETSTNETTVSETTPTMETLMEETTKIPSSEETTSSSTAEVPEGTNEVENSSSSTENEQETTTSSTSTDTSSTETSQTENNKETRNVTTDGNWDYTIGVDYAYLNSYVGSSTDVVVPNEIDGKQTKINLYGGLPTSTLKQQQFTSVVFSNEGGKKCKLNSGTMNFRSFANLQVFDGRGLDTSGLTSSWRTFMNLRNLRTVNLAGWDTSSINDMSDMFNGCQELTSIDVSNWNTSSVVNMIGMFNNCYKLASLDISHFNTSSVTKTGMMFSGCKSLKNLDINNFDLSEVTYMDYMFYDCASLPIIDLSNIKLGKSVSMNKVFWSNSPKNPLLVKATDPKLLNYDYASDNRVPIGPSFNANGGHFSDNSDTKYYFEKCALEPTDPKFQLSTFNDYKNTVEKPIKDDSFFDQWKLTNGTEPTKNDDLLNSNIVYSAQWIPSLINDHIPSQNVDNVKPNQSSIFGIAYMPKAFNFGSITLQDAGTQTIPLASGDYHIAVRDQRMNNDNGTIWKLEARLSWDQGKELSGAELITTNPGEVKKNINDGTSEFKDSDLISCAQVEAAGFSNVAIGSAPNTLMVGRGAIFHNAVFDYNLGNISLKIPETKNIEPGNYSGNVEWNLSFAP
ncbi:BspA family leucine-rich repeat surface protein [Enterococcus hirae]